MTNFQMPASCDSTFFPPHAEPADEGEVERTCEAIDPDTDATCSRRRGHLEPRVHWFEDCDFRIQWQEPPKLHTA